MQRLLLEADRDATPTANMSQISPSLDSRVNEMSSGVQHIIQGQDHLQHIIVGGDDLLLC